MLLLDELQASRNSINTKVLLSKTQRELMKRQHNSAALVIEIIIKDVNLSQQIAAKISYEEYNFVVLKDKINFTSLRKMTPRFHLPGLTLLLQKDIFVDAIYEVEKEKKRVGTTEK